MDSKKNSKFDGATVEDIGGHKTRISSTSPIKVKIGKGIEFPGLRVVELPRSFYEQELNQEFKKGRNGLNFLAMYEAWLYIFLETTAPRAVNKLSALMFKKDRYLEKDSFYESIRLSQLKKQWPIDRMVEFAEKDENQEEKLTDCFRKAEGFWGEDIKFTDEEINKIIEDFIVFQARIIMTINKGESIEKSISKARKEYYQKMRERYPDEKKRNCVKQSIGRGLEGMILAFWERTANKFAEKLKPHLRENELKLFRLLNTRQKFFGDRIIYYDFTRELFNKEYLKESNFLYLLILVKIYNKKVIGEYNFEETLERAIKNYLKVVATKRLMLPMDEKDKKAEQRLRGHEIPFSDNLSFSEETVLGSDNIEKNYQQKELKEKIKNIVKEQFSDREKQVYEYWEKGLSQKEIAEKIGCSHSYISKVWKDILAKFKENGLTKNDLVIFS